MTAVSEYKKWGDVVGTLDPSDVALGFRLADAAIAELERENERLMRQVKRVERAKQTKYDRDTAVSWVERLIAGPRDWMEQADAQDFVARMKCERAERESP